MNKKNIDFINQFRRLIKHFDQFHIFFNFRIGENFTYQTFIGGLINLFCLFLVMTYSIFGFISLISYSDSNIRYSSEQAFTNLKINKENFFYSVLIEDSKNEFNYSDYFIVDQKVVKRISSSYPSIERTKGLPCSNNKKNREFLEKSFHIANKSLDVFYCFDIPELNLTGNYNSEIFSFIEIDIKLNSTFYETNPVDLNDFKFNLLFSDRVINFRQGTIKDSINSVYSINFDEFEFYEYFNIYFNPLELNVDRNLFIKNFYHDSTFRYSQLEKGLLLNKKKDNVKYPFINKFFIRIDTEKEYIDIYYEKIPQFLSNLLALNKIFFLIFNLILSEWNSLKAKEYIFSRIFKYKDLFYSNFKRYKEIYPIEKPKKNQYNFNRNSILEDKYNLRDSEKKKHLTIKRKIPLKYKYLKDCEMFNISSERKQSFEISPNTFSLNITNNENSNLLKNQINSKTVENFDHSISIINSKILKKKNEEISEINNQINRLNLNQLEKTDLTINNQEEKIRIKELSEYSKDKLKDETKQMNGFIIDNTQKKFSEFDKKNINPVKIRLYDLFVRFCLCQKKKFLRKLHPFKFAEKMLFFYLDITTYMQKINEFEILKSVLFQDDFNRLMEFISKPIIISENTEASKISYQNEIFKYLSGRNFNSPNVEIEKITLDNIYSSYKKTKQNLTLKKNAKKYEEVEHKNNINIYFERQMEFLFNDC